MYNVAIKYNNNKLIYVLKDILLNNTESPLRHQTDFLRLIKKFQFGFVSAWILLDEER